jgi:hypothetical protein
MCKRNFILALIVTASLFPVGCANTNNTNSINRATTYDTNRSTTNRDTTNRDTNTSTSDIVGGFFGDWEYGNVRSDKYNASYDRNNRK